MSLGIDERKQAVETGINLDTSGVKESAINALQGAKQSIHARDDALSPRQFEQLVRSSHDLANERIALETQGILYLAGRLGLRKGEITHLKRDWFNWNDGTITIPEHQSCVKGQHDAEPCGYCRRRAEDRVDTNNITMNEAREALVHAVEVEEINQQALDEKAAELVKDVNISMADALANQWQPKTPQSARAIPFDFDVRVELALERFISEFDGWEHSAATVNRRVNRIQEQSPVDARVYPHALRATAASYHASRDISIHSLMSIMGWADPSTARAYVAANDEQAAREIRSKHR